MCSIGLGGPGSDGVSSTLVESALLAAHVSGRNAGRHRQAGLNPEAGDARCRGWWHRPRPRHRRVVLRQASGPRPRVTPRRLRGTASAFARAPRRCVRPARRETRSTAPARPDHPATAAPVAAAQVADWSGMELAAGVAWTSSPLTRASGAAAMSSLGSAITENACVRGGPCNGARRGRASTSADASLAAGTINRSGPTCSSNCSSGSVARRWTLRSWLR